MWDDYAQECVQECPEGFPHRLYGKDDDNRIYFQDCTYQTHVANSTHYAEKEYRDGEYKWSIYPNENCAYHYTRESRDEKMLFVVTGSNESMCVHMGLWMLSCPESNHVTTAIDRDHDILLETCTFADLTTLKENVPATDSLTCIHGMVGSCLECSPDNDNYIIYGKDDNQLAYMDPYFHSCSATMPTSDLLACESTEFTPPTIYKNYMPYEIREEPNAKLKVVCTPIYASNNQNNIVRHEISGVFTRNYISTNNCPNTKEEKVIYSGTPNEQTLQVCVIADSVLDIFWDPTKHCIPNSKNQELCGVCEPGFKPVLATKWGNYKYIIKCISDCPTPSENPLFFNRTDPVLGEVCVIGGCPGDDDTNIFIGVREGNKWIGTHCMAKDCFECPGYYGPMHIEDPEYGQYGPRICDLRREQWESYNFHELPAPTYKSNNDLKIPDDHIEELHCHGIHEYRNNLHTKSCYFCEHQENCQDAVYTVLHGSLLHDGNSTNPIYDRCIPLSDCSSSSLLYTDPQTGQKYCLEKPFRFNRNTTWTDITGEPTKHMISWDCAGTADVASTISLDDDSSEEVSVCTQTEAQVLTSWGTTKGTNCEWDYIKMECISCKPGFDYKQLGLRDPDSPFAQVYNDVERRKFWADCTDELPDAADPLLGYILNLAVTDNPAEPFQWKEVIYPLEMCRSDSETLYLITVEGVNELFCETPDKIGWTDGNCPGTLTTPEIHGNTIKKCHLTATEAAANIGTTGSNCYSQQFGQCEKCKPNFPYVVQGKSAGYLHDKYFYDCLAAPNIDEKHICKFELPEGYHDVRPQDLLGLEKQLSMTCKLIEQNSDGTPKVLQILAGNGIQNLELDGACEDGGVPTILSDGEGNDINICVAALDSVIATSMFDTTTNCHLTEDKECESCIPGHIPLFVTSHRVNYQSKHKPSVPRCIEESECTGSFMDIATTPHGKVCKHMSCPEGEAAIVIKTDCDDDYRQEIIFMVCHPISECWNCPSYGSYYDPEDENLGIAVACKVTRDEWFKMGLPDVLPKWENCKDPYGDPKVYELIPSKHCFGYTDSDGVVHCHHCEEQIGCDGAIYTTLHTTLVDKEKLEPISDSCIAQGDCGGSEDSVLYTDPESGFQSCLVKPTPSKPNTIWTTLAEDSTKIVFSWACTEGTASTVIVGSKSAPVCTQTMDQVLTTWGRVKGINCLWDDLNMVCSSCNEGFPYKKYGLMAVGSYAADFMDLDNEYWADCAAALPLTSDVDFGYENKFIPSGDSGDTFEIESIIHPIDGCISKENYWGNMEIQYLVSIAGVDDIQCIGRDSDSLLFYRWNRECKGTLTTIPPENGIMFNKCTLTAEEAEQHLGTTGNGCYAKDYGPCFACKPGFTYPVKGKSTEYVHDEYFYDCLAPSSPVDEQQFCSFESKNPFEDDEDREHNEDGYQFPNFKHNTLRMNCRDLFEEDDEHSLSIPRLLQIRSTNGDLVQTIELHKTCENGASIDSATDGSGRTDNVCTATEDSSFVADHFDDERKCQTNYMDKSGKCKICKNGYIPLYTSYIHGEGYEIDNPLVYKCILETECTGNYLELETTPMKTCKHMSCPMGEIPVIAMDCNNTKFLDMACKSTDCWECPGVIKHKISDPDHEGMGIDMACVVDRTMWTDLSLSGDPQLPAAEPCPQSCKLEGVDTFMTGTNYCQDSGDESCVEMDVEGSEKAWTSVTDATCVDMTPTDNKCRDEGGLLIDVNPGCWGIGGACENMLENNLGLISETNPLCIILTPTNCRDPTTGVSIPIDTTMCVNINMECILLSTGIERESESSNKCLQQTPLTCTLVDVDGIDIAEQYCVSDAGLCVDMATELKARTSNMSSLCADISDKSQGECRGDSHIVTNIGETLCKYTDGICKNMINEGMGRESDVDNTCSDLSITLCRNENYLAVEIGDYVDSDLTDIFCQGTNKICSSLKENNLGRTSDSDSTCKVLTEADCLTEFVHTTLGASECRNGDTLECKSMTETDAELALTSDSSNICVDITDLNAKK